MRFVILHHTAWPGNPDHYDLLIQFHEGTENDRFLKAFATQTNSFPVPSQPGDVRRESRFMPQEDHRIAYLTYQGMVGGGRGRVTRVDEGDCVHIAPPERDELKCRLTGARLKGLFRIRKLGHEDWCMEHLQESGEARTA